jgi:tryptophan synthase alpha chain
VFIAAQTSPPERLKLLAEAGDGFVYAASLLGVTGVRESLNSRVRSLVENIRAQTSLPVAVGIGVSTAEHAKEVAQFADGVIVGSAVVARVRDAKDPAAAVAAFVAELRAACAR